MSVGLVAGVAVAGAIGAPARYVLDGLVENRIRGTFPWGTFVINVTGSLLLGIITGAALYHGFSSTPRVWLGTGFCGAYTTFSTFTFQSVGLLEGGETGKGLGYMAASVVTATAAAAAGLGLAAM